MNKPTPPDELQWSYHETIARFVAYCGGPWGDSPLETAARLMGAYDHDRQAWWWKWVTDDGLDEGEPTLDRDDAVLAAYALRDAARTFMRDWERA